MKGPNTRNTDNNKPVKIFLTKYKIFHFGKVKALLFQMKMSSESQLHMLYLIFPGKTVFKF